MCHIWEFLLLLNALECFMTFCESRFFSRILLIFLECSLSCSKDRCLTCPLRDDFGKVPHLRISHLLSNLTAYSLSSSLNVDFRFLYGDTVRAKCPTLMESFSFRSNFPESFLSFSEHIPHRETVSAMCPTWRFPSLLSNLL